MNYPANEARFQPVHAPCVTTWIETLQKWITGAARHNSVPRKTPPPTAPKPMMI